MNYIYNQAVYSAAGKKVYGEGYWSSYETYIIIGNQNNIYVTKDIEISGGLNLILQRYYMYIWENNSVMFSFNLGAKYNF